MHEVVGHRGGEVAADRPRGCVRRVRRADRRAQGRDRAVALDDESPGRPGGDELDELAEERLLAVLGVVLLAELTACGHELPLPDLEASRLDPPEDLAGEPALYRVWLEQQEASLDGHGQLLLEQLLLARPVPTSGCVRVTACEICGSQIGR